MGENTGLHIFWDSIDNFIIFICSFGGGEEERAIEQIRGHNPPSGDGMEGESYPDPTDPFPRRVLYVGRDVDR
jgi:hypothetical protein